MKRQIKSALGVTLLEIMLVLAIAAMIILMSVRYYQSATLSQQTNSAFDEIVAIIAAADNLSQSTGDYSLVTTTTVGDIVGTTNMKTPWATAISLDGTAKSSFKIDLGTIPAAACQSLQAKFSGNPKATPTCTSGAFSLVYTMTPST